MRPSVREELRWSRVTVARQDTQALQGHPFILMASLACTQRTEASELGQRAGRPPEKDDSGEKHQALLNQNSKGEKHSSLHSGKRGRKRRRQQGFRQAFLFCPQEFEGKSEPRVKDLLCPFKILSLSLFFAVLIIHRSWGPWKRTCFPLPPAGGSSSERKIKQPAWKDTPFAPTPMPPHAPSDSDIFQSDIPTSTMWFSA